MTQPPNIREVDCCGKCEYMGLEYDCDWHCTKHSKRQIEFYNICDDFKREE